jgi:hypothetical protein
MRKAKGIGRWKGKDVPGMYQDGGSIDPSKMMLDNLKKNPYGPKGYKKGHLGDGKPIGPRLTNFDSDLKNNLSKMDSLSKEQAFRTAAQKIAAQMNEKAKWNLKRKR